MKLTSAGLLLTLVLGVNCSALAYNPVILACHCTLALDQDNTALSCGCGKDQQTPIEVISGNKFATPQDDGSVFIHHSKWGAIRKVKFSCPLYTRISHFHFRKRIKDIESDDATTDAMQTKYANEKTILVRRDGYMQNIQCDGGKPIE